MQGDINGFSGYMRFSDSHSTHLSTILCTNNMSSMNVMIGIGELE